jgi:hypothetical protein
MSMQVRISETAFREDSAAVRLLRRALVALLLVLFPVGSAFAAEGSVTRKARLSGAYGYRVRSDAEADPAFVQTNLLARERVARFSWLSKGKRLRFVAGTPTGTRVVIARAVSGRKAHRRKKARWEVSLDKTAGSNAPALTLRVYEQGGKSTDFDLGSVNRRASIEVRWTAATTSSSNDGAVAVLRNGKMKVDATDLDNRFRLGAFAIGMLTNPDRIQKNRAIYLDRVWVTHL